MPINARPDSLYVSSGRFSFQNPMRRDPMESAVQLSEKIAQIRKLRQAQQMADREASRLERETSMREGAATRAGAVEGREADIYETGGGAQGVVDLRNRSLMSPLERGAGFLESQRTRTDMPPGQFEDVRRMAGATPPVGPRQTAGTVDRQNAALAGYGDDIIGYLRDKAKGVAQGRAEGTPTEFSAPAMQIQEEMKAMLIKYYGIDESLFSNLADEEAMAMQNALAAWADRVATDAKMQGMHKLIFNRDPSMANILIQQDWAPWQNIALGFQGIQKRIREEQLQSLGLMAPPVTFDPPDLPR